MLVLDLRESQENKVTHLIPESTSILLMLFHCYSKIQYNGDYASSKQIIAKAACNDFHKELEMNKITFGPKLGILFHERFNASKTMHDIELSMSILGKKGSTEAKCTWFEWVMSRVLWSGWLWYKQCMIWTAVSVFPVPGGPTTIVKPCWTPDIIAPTWKIGRRIRTTLFHLFRRRVFKGQGEDFLSWGIFRGWHEGGHSVTEIESKTFPWKFLGHAQCKYMVVQRNERR